ncbi:hypothetical protein [Peribacillus deserti]|uniref:Uncharacterized protein n=1 Tax=Peribacillus deserti TaxID=673318 RepID=A0A2N5M4P6_9BACI|nr:hypothetical protein [Peribacillus deserti]PLT29330.1 hypothetical protein CUU66_13500 [Peribacillus deserti]
MNNKLFIIISIFLVLTGGCTDKTVIHKRDTDYSSVEPHTLSGKEKNLLQLTTIEPSELLVYNVHLIKEHKVNVKVDYYKNKELKQTFINMTSSLKKGDSLISAGFDNLPGDPQNKRIWFAAMGGAKGSTVESMDINKGTASSIISINDKKELLHDKYTVIGVYIQNSFETDLHTVTLENEHSLDTILKENENVYMISFRIKGS